MNIEINVIYQAGHEDDARYMTHHITTACIDNIEAYCIKHYVGGRCTQVILAASVNGEIRKQARIYWSKYQRPSKFDVHDALELIRYRTRPVRKYVSLISR